MFLIVVIVSYRGVSYSGGGVYIKQLMGIFTLNLTLTRLIFSHVWNLISSTVSWAIFYGMIFWNIWNFVKLSWNDKTRPLILRLLEINFTLNLKIEHNFRSGRFHRPFATRHTLKNRTSKNVSNIGRETLDQSSVKLCK